MSPFLLNLILANSDEFTPLNMVWKQISWPKSHCHQARWLKKQKNSNINIFIISLYNISDGYIRNPLNNTIKKNTGTGMFKYKLQFVTGTCTKNTPGIIILHRLQAFYIVLRKRKACKRVKFKCGSYQCEWFAFCFGLYHTTGYTG